MYSVVEILWPIRGREGGGLSLIGLKPLKKIKSFVDGPLAYLTFKILGIVFYTPVSVIQLDFFSQLGQF